MADTNELIARIDSIKALWLKDSVLTSGDIMWLIKQARTAAEQLATPPADAALADVLKIVESQLGHAADVGATYVAFTRDETIRIAARLRALSQPATVAQVPELYCVGRANYPPRGGNVGINWHVVGVADVPYRTCVPKNGELLFVLAASQSATEECAALRARPQAVAEGFALVPVEPTGEMLAAGAYLAGQRNYEDSEIRNIYQDMLAASQSATGGAK